MEVVAVRRGAVRSVVVAGLLVLGGAAGAGSAGARGGPEAELAYHGRVSLSHGQLRVWLVPQNGGPAEVPAATVRVRLSADLADGQELAAGCARVGTREVMCETGALPPHGQGRHIGLVLRLREAAASEVVVRVDTWWNGGTADRNHGAGEHVVLALDTGDAYAF